MGVTVVTSGGNIDVTTGLKVQTGSGIVQNSDLSYDTTVASGATLSIPDITITKNDDTTVTYPAVKDLDIGIIDPCTIPATWDEMVAQYGIGYNYPQPTGQTTIYRTGDDAWVEQNIFNDQNPFDSEDPARLTNSLKPQQSLFDFTTLNNNNAFGNTARFTDELGTEVFTNDLVIDHFTGLMWYRQRIGVDTWDNLIDQALASTQGGYDDWFLCNTMQIMTISNLEANIALNYAPFNTIPTGNQNIYTSTTNTAITDRAIRYSIDSTPLATIEYNQVFKTATIYGMLCRKHY